MKQLTLEQRVKVCLGIARAEAFDPSQTVVVNHDLEGVLTRHFKEAVEQEREACAQVAAGFDSGTDDLQRGSDGRNIAAAIRARGADPEDTPFFVEAKS